MNLFSIIDQISKADPEVYDRLDGRRAAFRHMAGFGKKAATAAIPLALSSIFSKAYGQGGSGQQVIDTLNFALTLEYLEAEFYTQALASGGLIPSGPATNAVTTIKNHETAHVAALDATIRQLGGTPAAKPEFDFTASGMFSDVFSNYATFLAVAQSFEDTGVRAYKGQAANLMSNKPVLTAALQIHSVEARHASHIRQMRSANISNAGLKPWITGNNSFDAPAAIYAGEENTTQAGVNIVTNSSITSEAASESFDEPLTRAQVEAIVTPFIK